MQTRLNKSPAEWRAMARRRLPATPNDNAPDYTLHLSSNGIHKKKRQKNKDTLSSLDYSPACFPLLCWIDCPTKEEVTKKINKGTK